MIFRAHILVPWHWCLPFLVLVLLSDVRGVRAVQVFNGSGQFFAINILMSDWGDDSVGILSNEGVRPDTFPFPGYEFDGGEVVYCLAPGEHICCKGVDLTQTYGGLGLLGGGLSSAMAVGSFRGGAAMAASYPGGAPIVGDSIVQDESGCELFIYIDVNGAMHSAHPYCWWKWFLDGFWMGGAWGALLLVVAAVRKGLGVALEHPGSV